MYNKYVTVNTTDLPGAIRAGWTPMYSMYDPTRGQLPYFRNVVSPSLENSHHCSWSAGDVTGRWLDALLESQEALNEPVCMSYVEILKKWVYKVLDNDVHLAACMDPNTLELMNQYDVHTLRQTMFSLNAIYKLCKDEKALALAQKHIEAIDRYYDLENCCWKEEQFTKETGGRLVNCVSPVDNGLFFTATVGRYANALVKLYRSSGLQCALDQAIRIKETGLKHALPANGNYIFDYMGDHVHSTTSTVAAMAQLGSLTNDKALLDWVEVFMENGMKTIALDFGWCAENIYRDDWVGELNNTADILETCLTLGRMGKIQYYAQAEKIVRAHMLPSQLLDTQFIRNEDNPGNDSLYHLPERMRGSFGFACPFGHEDHPEAEISFNWDIIGGAISGLCLALKHSVMEVNGFTSINLLFDCDNDLITFESPYTHDGHAAIIAKKNAPIRLRVSKDFDEISFQCGASVSAVKTEEWIYFFNVQAGDKIELTMPMKTYEKDYTFRNRLLRTKWRGESIVGMSSTGKRLCYFPEI